MTQLPGVEQPARPCPGDANAPLRADVGSAFQLHLGGTIDPLDPAVAGTGGHDANPSLVVRRRLPRHGQLRNLGISRVTDCDLRRTGANSQRRPSSSFRVFLPPGRSPVASSSSRRSRQSAIRRAKERARSFSYMTREHLLPPTGWTPSDAAAPGFPPSPASRFQYAFDRTIGRVPGGSTSGCSSYAPPREWPRCQASANSTPPS